MFRVTHNAVGVYHPAGGSVPCRRTISDFAVGFSRQPLPKNKQIVMNTASGPGISATDATVRSGLELAKLRPETLEYRLATLRPTATLFPSSSSWTGDVRAGFNNKKTITG